MIVKKEQEAAETCRELRGSFIETGIEIFDRSLPMFRNIRLQRVTSVSGAKVGSLLRRRVNSL